MSKFTPYDDWEVDVAQLADQVAKMSVLRPSEALHETCLRILAAFDPEKTCGAMLGYADGDIGPYLVASWNSPRGNYARCNLPKGHHPYRPKLAWRVGRDPLFLEPCCYQPPEVPIHSPGHVLDVPDECWREA